MCDEKWICKACIEINESSKSEESDEHCKKNPSNKDLLKMMNRKFAEDEKALTFNGEVMDELQKTIKLITDENKNLKKEQKKVKEHVKELEKKITILEKRLNKEEELGRRKNIVITDLKDDKNASNNVKKVFSKLSEVDEDYQISILPTVNVDKSVIVVQFKTEERRNRILVKKKTMFLDSENCGIDDKKSKIFMNEDLSRPTRELYKQGRELRQKEIQYVWCKNGQVYARKAEGEQMVKINSVADIEKFH
nr:unnamed protein product [Callosobruchus analis]